MRPIPDAAAWIRLSTLFDAGCDLPPDLRSGWLETLVEDEPPIVIDWLRDMLAAAEATEMADGSGVGSGDDRGPLLLVRRGSVEPAEPAEPVGPVEPNEPAEPAEPGEPGKPAKPGARTRRTKPARLAEPERPRGASTVAPLTDAPATAPAPADTPAAEATTGLAASGYAADEAPARAPELEPAEASVSAPTPTPIELAAAETSAHEEPAPQPADEPAQLPEPEHAPEAVARQSAPALATGMHLGPWVLLGPMTSSDVRVGQWRARRADEAAPGREVAVLVPPQWRPRADLAAWLAHAAARATSLVHPHIARLVAVGVADDGTPWLACELAEGQSLDRWCRDRALGLPERRLLLGQALEAAAFAHGRLVAHGHVHPSQVIVTPEGRLRFLNFGLADLLDLLDVPAPAAQGVAGPPPSAYAAPEQQGGATIGSAGAPSAAADIYTLGLIAFEVLSGASPWQPRAPGAAAATAPGSRWPRPSDFANTPRLRRALRGDLDAIVVRATQTDPALRYPSAAAFLDDTRRAGAFLPVAAVDGGFLYQVGRLAKRHPRVTATTMVGVVATFVFLAALSWKAWVWTRERDEAETARRSGEAVTRLMQDLLRDSALPGGGRDWPETLAHAESVARSSLTEQPVGLARALALLGRHQAERGAFAEGRNLLAEALPNLVNRTAAQEAGCDEAWAQARQGDKPDEAELRLRRVTENVSAAPETRVLCLTRLADLEHRSGRARDAYLTTFNAWQLWSDTDDKAPQLALLLARPMGLQSAALGRFHESQLWFEWALKQLHALRQDSTVVGIELREQWGEVSLAAGDAERAMKLADENLTAVAGGAFPADADPATAAPAALFLAAAEPRLDLHRVAEARARLERALALAEARDNATLRQQVRCTMAMVAMRERDLAAADRWLKSADAEGPAAGGRAAGGTGARSTAQGAAGGGDGSATAGAAAPLPAGLIGVAPSSPEAEARNAARAAQRRADHACRAATAEFALQQGRHTEAQREAENLLALGDELSPRLRAVVNLLRAEATLAARQYDRAVSAGLQALQQARALHQSDVEDQKARPSLRSGQAAVVLAEAHRASGDIEEAKKTLDYAMQQLAATLPDSHPWRRRADATKAALAVHATKKP